MSQTRSLAETATLHVLPPLQIQIDQLCKKESAYSLYMYMEVIDLSSVQSFPGILGQNKSNCDQPCA